MTHHIKKVLWDKPDYIIFHVKTNDILSDRDAGVQNQSLT